MTKCDVAIIGAGPYGLSATAHLRTVKGLDLHTFGEAYVFLGRHTCRRACCSARLGSIAYSRPKRVVDHGEEYQAASRTHFPAPYRSPNFVGYGNWYQRHALPDLDQRKIARVESVTNGF